uniref:Scavenger receptor class F member 1 n=1 Tax=Varanus komodoensis TaxID=61221 RepID=A0A8D2IN43_VARKO
MAAWSRELPCSATREGMPRATGAASSGGGVWRARGLLLTIRFSPASQPPVFTCCSGWKQEGRECPTALCEGDEACRGDEVCVRPGVCRCRPGFFGAGCATRCPGQFWGPDCKESCHCHPDGTCDPAGGTCSCHPGRWGPLCQFACACGPRGHCDPLSGACRCRPGWWGPECRRQCLCDQAGSRCDPGTGRCLCHRGRWGRRCSFACSCNGSPCAQQSGRCECRSGLWGAACQNPCQCRHGTCAPQDGRCACDAGYRGPSCSEPCPAGSFGPRCKSRCGHCKDPSSCSPVNGSCPECEPGWMGADCQRLCPPGRHGENCSQPCPRCFRGEPCHPETGACQSCEAGLQGPRCEDPCPAGLFGAGCQFRCPDCANGSCDPASGACVCQAGFWGASCNRTCPAGLHGPNCSAPCQCPGGACHPASGACQGGALLPAILVPLLLLLLLGLACYCCCCSKPALADPGSRYQPGCPQKPSCRGHWPVSHHDTEMPFNPSFIEPPSAAWPSDSSFDTDEDEEGGSACPLPAGEAPPPTAELALHSVRPPSPEPFSIPRTSSVAKAKRPSVSFAEGTRFGPQSPRHSVEAPTTPHDALGSCYENVEARGWADESPRGGLCHTPAGHRKGTAGSRLVAQRVEALEATTRAHGHEPSSVTTIYVAVGKAGPGGEGPVQALLQRLGSLRRARPVSREEPRPRRPPEGLQRAPWGAPASHRLQPPGLSPSPDVAELEAGGQGPLGGAPAPVGEGPGESGGAQASPSPSQLEMQAGGLDSEEGQEPQYENVCRWSGSP